MRDEIIRVRKNTGRKIAQRQNADEKMSEEKMPDEKRIWNPSTLRALSLTQQVVLQLGVG